VGESILKVVNFAVHELNFVVTVWLQGHIQHTDFFFGSPSVKHVCLQSGVQLIFLFSHIDLGFVV
jgi:hypothetical protein